MPPLSKPPMMPVSPETHRNSARAWTAVALYRFDDGLATHDGVALRVGLRTFEGIKIMSKIKIKKSTLHRVNEIHVKSRSLSCLDPVPSTAPAPSNLRTFVPH